MAVHAVANELELNNNVRPLAHYHPHLWGDRFLNFLPPDEVTRGEEQEANKLKDEMREKLLAVVSDFKERLILIDSIEQLGVAYHFEEEIEANLQEFYKNYYSRENHSYKDDLYYVSLRFRLLGQHGIYVSSDVFNTFTNDDRSFKESLTKDVRGVLNLYEAAYLRVHGEKILDEAVEFTTSQLESMDGQLSHPLSAQVTQALKLPLHKGITRLEEFEL